MKKRNLSYFLKKLSKNKIGFLILLMCLLFIFCGIFAPLISPYDPYKTNSRSRLQPPSKSNLLGTDELGRDVLSRVIWGARISMSIAIITVSISVLVGVIIGMISGYVGGIVDDIIMRITDIFLAFPSLILAMALTAALGPSVINAAIALGIVWWPSYARLIRGQVLSVKNKPYIESARALGAGHLRIILKHLWPNCYDPVLVRMTMTGGNAILMASGLSFIGLGAQPPQAEWGLMVALGRQFLTTAWWYPTIVGFVIFFAVISFTLASDTLQELLETEKFI